jgi:hypothetical protein
LRYISTKTKKETECGPHAEWQTCIEEGNPTTRKPPRNPGRKNNRQKGHETLFEPEREVIHFLLGLSKELRLSIFRNIIHYDAINSPGGSQRGIIRFVHFLFPFFLRKRHLSSSLLHLLFGVLDSPRQVSLEESPVLDLLIRRDLPVSTRTTHM